MSPRTSPRRPPTLEEVFSLLRSVMPELRERHGVKTLGVFGSYLHAGRRRPRDLDLLVEFERAPTLFEFVELQERLSGLLKVEVDLVMKSALKPTIGERILAETVPV